MIAQPRIQAGDQERYGPEEKSFCELEIIIEIHEAANRCKRGEP